jgi:hypothetical protein
MADGYTCYTIPLTARQALSLLRLKRPVLLDNGLLMYTPDRCLPGI